MTPHTLGSKASRKVTLTLGLPSGWRLVETSEDFQSVLDTGSGIGYQMVAVHAGIAGHTFHPVVQVTVSELRPSQSDKDARDLMQMSIEHKGKNGNELNPTKPDVVHLAFADATTVSYDVTDSENNVPVLMRTTDYQALAGRIWVEVETQVPAYQSDLNGEVVSIVKTLDVN